MTHIVENGHPIRSSIAHHGVADVYLDSSSLRPDADFETEGTRHDRHTQSQHGDHDDGNARHLAVAGGDLIQCQQGQGAGFRSRQENDRAIVLRREHELDDRDHHHGLRHERKDDAQIGAPKAGAGHARRLFKFFAQLDEIRFENLRRQGNAAEHLSNHQQNDGAVKRPKHRRAEKHPQ